MLYVQNGGILNFIKVKIVWCEVLGFDQTTGLSLTMHQDWLTMQTQLREPCNLRYKVYAVYAMRTQRTLMIIIIIITGCEGSIMRMSDTA